METNTQTVKPTSTRRETILIQPLPETFFPEQWKDDKKMGWLMATFRPFNLNPENYTAKMSFWKNLVSSYCVSKGSSEFSIQELKRVFTRKNCAPQCLDKVIEEMFIETDIQEKHKFMELPKTAWGEWAIDLLVRKPFVWGVTKVKEQIVAMRDESTVYVCKEVINSQSEALHTLFQDSYDMVLSKEDILNTLEKTGLSVAGLDLVLHHLRCQQRIWIETTAEGKTLCKFAPPNAKVLPITDMERSIFTLEETEASLSKVIDKLEVEINNLNMLTKQCLKDGKKQAAKMHLKKRHTLERQLEKKTNVLENVQEMLSKIHDTQKDMDVLSAYRVGTDALKNGLAGSGITLDSVDDILEEMKEQIEVHDEIQAGLGSPVKDLAVDEAELEDELNDLLADEKPSGGDAGGKVPEAVVGNFDEEIEKRLKGLRIETHSLPAVNLAATQQTQ